MTCGIMANCCIFNSRCPVARQQAEASTSGRSSTPHCLHGLFARPAPKRTACQHLQKTTRHSRKRACHSKPQVVRTAATSISSSSEVWLYSLQSYRTTALGLRPVVSDCSNGTMRKTTMWSWWEQGTLAVRQLLPQQGLAVELCYLP